MPPAEPSLVALSNPVLRYVMATRPAFLSVTLAACLIGLASSFASQDSVHALTATITVLFALVAHAGINVLNDYYDALNGTDANNVERIFPFTGGSRFIQNGVLTTTQTAVFGTLLLGIVILAGLWLTAASGPGLIGIGLAGLLIGWAYSAPPLRLNSRGLGEVCVWAGFTLIAIGADFVQRGTLSALPLVAASAYGLLVTNILYINQFPDRKADLAAGKRHWVARLAPETARWGYVLMASVAYLWVLGAVIVHALPWTALFALLPAALSFAAARDVVRFAAKPSRLAPAIARTIGAANLHGVLMTGALIAGRLLA